MNIIPNRRKTDQLVTAVAKAERRLGQLYVCSLVRPALLAQDCAAALGIIDEIEREAVS